MDYFKLTEEKLSLDCIMDMVKSPKCGAVSFFAGTTRNNFEGLKVKELVYHAYETMAYKTLKNVSTEIRKKWPEVENIAIYHRLGIVPVMETSVIIAISSPHRAESLAAVQFAIDILKSSVPVWKKEEYEDGKSEWKENKECPWSSNSEPSKHCS